MSGRAEIRTKLSAAGRMVLTLLLTLFVLAPSFDFECAAEGLPTVLAIGVAAPVMSVEATTAPAPSSPHGRGLCPHGHCHNALVAALPEVTPFTVPLAGTASALKVLARTLTSTLSSRLERPPKA